MRKIKKCGDEGLYVAWDLGSIHLFIWKLFSWSSPSPSKRVFSTMSFVSWDIINFAFLKPAALSSLLTYAKQLLPHLTGIWTQSIQICRKSYNFRPIAGIKTPMQSCLSVVPGFRMPLRIIIGECRASLCSFGREIAKILRFIQLHKAVICDVTKLLIVQVRQQQSGHWFKSVRFTPTWCHSNSEMPVGRMTSICCC